MQWLGNMLLLHEEQLHTTIQHTVKKKNSKI